MRDSERHVHREPSAWAQTLPLVVVASGSALWHGTRGFSRTYTGFWGLELVTYGDGRFEQDGRQYRLEPGDVFILRQGAANAYRVGPSKVMHKRYLQIRGAASDRIFTTALQDTDIVRVPLRDRARVTNAFRTIHAALADYTDRASVVASEAAYRLVLALSVARGSRDQPGPYMREFVAWVQQHIDKPVSCRDAADNLGITTAHLGRLTHMFLGMSPKQYLLDQKARVASGLLHDTDASVASVAAQVGFADPLYFSHAFKRATAKSPTAYRAWARRHTT